MMKVITINISEKHNRAIQKIVDWGLYPSKCECFRSLIDLGIPILQKEIRYIESLLEKKDIQNIKKYMEERGYKISSKPDCRTKKKKPLGNPYWECYINEDDQVAYRPKEESIKIPSYKDEDVNVIRRLG